MQPNLVGSPTDSPSAPKTPIWLKAVRTLVVIILLSFISYGFIVYADAKQKSDEKNLVAQTQAKNDETDRLVKLALQKRIDFAKSEEARARNNSEKYEKELLEKSTKPQPNQEASKKPSDCGVKDPASYTVVINKQNCFSPIDWQPTDLVSVEGFKFRNEPSPYLIDMMASARTAGVGFNLASTYRSYTDQKTVYDGWLALKSNNTLLAESVSARPGYSEHQTGLAIDIKTTNCSLECLKTSPQYLWLKQRAHEFGFVERYPEGLASITGYSHEPWHWRFIGIEDATRMKNLGIETLEMFYRIKGGEYSQ